MADAEDKRIAQEAKKLEVALAKEAKAESKHLAQAEKALKSSNKDLAKAEKNASKTSSALDKAARTEYNTARKLNEAQHTHDIAVANHSRVESDLALRQKAVAEKQRQVYMHQTALDEALRAKDAHEAEREAKLASAREAVAAQTGGIAADVAATGQTLGHSAATDLPK